MAYAGSSDRTRDGRTAGEELGPRAEDRSRAQAPERDAGARPEGGAERPARGARRGAGAAQAGGAHDEDEMTRRPRGRPFTRTLELDVDWRRAGSFGAGLAVGALLGAAVALLAAPASGADTRRRLRRAGSRAGSRAADAFADLGEELRHATYRTRRRIRRGLRGGSADLFGGGQRKSKKRKAARERHEAEGVGDRPTWMRRRRRPAVVVED